MLPCLIFEDDHLLVVNKPAGLNTHAPGPYAGEGLYDWLRHREPRWATLAIVHRLDKETSGVIVFSKSTLANRSLTEQFTRHEVRKKYLLLTDRKVPPSELTVRSCLVRAGDRYLSRPLRSGAAHAETHFRPRPDPALNFALGGSNLAQTVSWTVVEAEPMTGRTHQIRVHAAERGFPVLGDTLYAGTPAARVYLHAAELTLKHPASGKPLTFATPLSFEADARQALREALLDPAATDAYRVLHGASDGWPDWYVERLGPYLFSQSEAPLSAYLENPLHCRRRRKESLLLQKNVTSAKASRLPASSPAITKHAPSESQASELDRLMERFAARGAYHKRLTRHLRRTSVAEASPQLMLGTPAPERFTIRENGLHFELSFAEGYSTGLFLDQRDNRRRLLTAHVAAGFALFQTQNQPRKPQVLNTFAYTCGYSVCAAKAGSHTTSLDLSKKYLEWGKRNFMLNELPLAEHDFIYGDVFDWLKRFEKKRRFFDVLLLDPPTFSQSKESGVFRAEKDYGELVAAALPLLQPGGVLFASTNAANWSPEVFLAAIQAPVRAAGRKVLKLHYAPQPPDFPISRAEPAHLKTVWLRLD
ncbi:MAG TPA: pseudouridine synthase [Candidatus Acidoferrum sp.]|nr:pseudouridine synthase [Candidatus Acidoferrum sp.]